MRPKPSPFFNVLLHFIEPLPGLTGLCAGFENGQWRFNQFSDHLMEWLPDFALNHEELKDFTSGNAVKFIRKAANTIYKTKKFKKRGEFGELLLHAAMREIFNTIPAISKIYYEDAENDTIKGFDAVHVVENEDALELWLGEAKFYNNINNAINDVVKEINDHTKIDYLKSEFTLISNKIEPTWEHSEVLKKLLDPKTSLDEVFDCACIPVLLTYDSDTITKHNKTTQEYKDQILKELQKHHKSFSEKNLPSELRIHLFLIPLMSKRVFNEKLDEKLKTWQKI